MHSFDSVSWWERSTPVVWTCVFLLRRSAGITGQANRARARSAHYPDEAGSALQHQGVREKESPSNRLRTLHLTAVMISIRCAAAERFYGSIFQQVRKIQKGRAAERRVEIAWAEHFLPFFLRRKRLRSQDASLLRRDQLIINAPPANAAAKRREEIPQV